MQLDRFLKRQEVEAATGYTRSSIYRLIALGQFPRPIAFTARSVRWRASDVAEWQQQKIEQSEQVLAA
jgi:prophage regulatory protein